MEVLWLDDDAPNLPKMVGDVLVTPALDCAAAAQILASEQPLPQWVIVDLIVPQNGWGKHYYEVPGVKFLEYIKTEYCGRIKTAVFSVALNSRSRELALQAGALRMFNKQSTSLLDVLHEIREYETTSKISFLQHLNPKDVPTEDVEPKSRLRSFLEDHAARHFSAIRPFSRSYLQEVYKAMLAVEDNGEKRERAYQTLQALRDNPLDEIQHSATDTNELNQLRRLIAAMVDGKRARNDYDVFLCYNSTDQSEVASIAEKLIASGILPWYDRWQVRPGERWRRILEHVIEDIPSAAVFTGKNGIGPWQDLELDGLLQQLSSRKSPVIPVLLSTAPSIPSLPLFLKGVNWVDFRDNKDSTLYHLIWGITGWKL